MKRCEIAFKLIKKNQNFLIFYFIIIRIIILYLLLKIFITISIFHRCDIMYILHHRC